MVDNKETKDVHGFFSEDPEKADKEFFGRVANPDRRGFLKRTGLATMAAMVGPFHRNMPIGFVPAAVAAEDVLVGKHGLTLLNDRPVNAETPPELLDDAITPTARHFVRNNGIPPENTSPNGWTLTIDGFVDDPVELSIDDLKSQFEVVTMALTGFVAQIGFGPHFPLLRTDLSYGLCDRYAKRGVAI